MAEKKSKSTVGTALVLPKAIPNKAKSATPASTADKGRALKRDTKENLVSSVSDVRTATTVIEAIRMLCNDEGVTSNAVFTAAAISNTPFKLTAYQTNTNIFDPEATRLANWILASMDTLQDYTKKFADKPTVRSFIEAALLDCQKTAGVGCELVLGDDKLPSYLQLVSYEQIEYVSDGKGGRKPIQKMQGTDDVDLDLPNFWIAELNKDPTKAYSIPILRAALNTSVTNHEFIEDMRRSVNKTGHSRLVVTLDSEKITATAPEDVIEDPKKLMTYLTAHQAAVTKSLEGLSPEDSIVVFDNLDVDVADIGGNKADYVDLMKTLNNMQATSLKTPSSIVGLRSDGSQSLSNVEALTYLKTLLALRGPVQDVLSRAFTLAVRLYGSDVYVKFEFDPINLRPEDELEAFRTMKQQRQLELLSLGIWTDERYCHESGNVYHPDMPELSGTNFFQKAAVKVGEDVDNSGGAEQQLNSDAPKKGGGKSP